ncbi:hypothetical protein V5043_08220 [Enterobacter kobei]
MHFIISLLMTLTGLFYHLPSAASEPLFSPEERRWIAEHQQVIYNVIPSWPLDYEEKGQHFGLSRDCRAKRTDAVRMYHSQPR